MATDVKIHSRGRLLTAAGLALLLASAGQAGPRKPEEFKNGIKAQDRGDWPGSVPLFRQSLEKLPEDGELVRIYGTKYKSYLPHYYIGLALYKQNDCAGALEEWEECLGVGAIQATEEHQALHRLLLDCKERSPNPSAGRPGAPAE
jgi:hypothetical protein